LLPSAPALALTVDQAVEAALTHNLSLQTEDLKVAQKADEKNLSFGKLYPSISTNLTVMRLNNLNTASSKGMWDGMLTYLSQVTAHQATKIPYYEFPNTLTEDNQWNLAANVSVQFQWSPAVYGGIVQTLIDYDNAVLSRRAAQAKLERDVRKAFYQLLALHEATLVLDSQLKVAEGRYKLAKVNYEAGLGSEIAMLQAQVAWESRKPLVADQKLNEANAQAAFRILLNLPDDAALDLSGTLNIEPADRAGVAYLDPEPLLAHYSNGRFDVGSLRGTAKSLNNLADAQAMTLLPALVFGYSMDPAVNAPFKDNKFTDPANWAQSGGNFMVGVGWKLDGLLPGSSTSLQISNLKRQAQQAQLGAEQTLRAGQVEVRSLVGKAKKSATSLESLTLALTLAQRSSRLTEAGYQAGNSSFNDAQDADLQLQSARLQLLNEELALHSTLADLDYALAVPRSEWFHG
jgi:outer membrane protein TolC